MFNGDVQLVLSLETELLPNVHVLTRYEMQTFAIPHARQTHCHPKFRQCFFFTAKKYKRMSWPGQDLMCQMTTGVKRQCRLKDTKK